MSKKHGGKKQASSDGVVLRMYDNVPELEAITALVECPNCNASIHSMGEGAIKVEVYPAKIRPKPKNGDMWELFAGGLEAIDIRRAALFRKPEKISVPA